MWNSEKEKKTNRKIPKFWHIQHTISFGGDTFAPFLFQFDISFAVFAVHKNKKKHENKEQEHIKIQFTATFIDQKHVSTSIFFWYFDFYRAVCRKNSVYWPEKVVQCIFFEVFDFGLLTTSAHIPKNKITLRFSFSANRLFSFQHFAFSLCWLRRTRMQSKYKTIRISRNIHIYIVARVVFNFWKVIIFLLTIIAKKLAIVKSRLRTKESAWKTFVSWFFSCFLRIQTEIETKQWKSRWPHWANIYLNWMCRRIWNWRTLKHFARSNRVSRHPKSLFCLKDNN